MSLSRKAKAATAEELKRGRVERKTATAEEVKTSLSRLARAATAEEVKRGQRAKNS